MYFKKMLIKNLVKSGIVSAELNNDELSEFLKDNFADFIDFTIKQDWSNYLITRDFSNVKTIVLSSRIGIAKNGIFWIDNLNIPDPMILFASKQIVIKFRKENIVKDMKSALQKINPSKLIFGFFISGPFFHKTNKLGNFNIVRIKQLIVILI
ncbi:hypothetical protein GM418_29910 [Maribellus comscasis]|uniref:LUD domain-containing protein n=1 Tax=Maribellus comscasis TaxID=2681766 RepID=A0A6I6K2P6_9BACT|nr:LUD domain-containing protein [Maribellus comscasis]QGY47728.1 hypothetical protein GM418_29910 [Maribellus comscasis]